MDYLCDCKTDLYAMTETWLTEEDAAVRVELNPDRSISYKKLQNPEIFSLFILIHGIK